jgi:hypothetical protein
MLTPDQILESDRLDDQAGERRPTSFRDEEAASVGPDFDHPLTVAAYRPEPGRDEPKMKVLVVEDQTTGDISLQYS